MKSIVGILQSDPVIRRELMYGQILENIITVFNRRKNTPAKLHLSNYDLAYGTSEKWTVDQSQGIPFQRKHWQDKTHLS